MKYTDVCTQFEKLLNKNTTLWQQTHIMYIPKIKYIIGESPIGVETRIRYKLDTFWYEFEYKENKVLFMINKYLETLLDGLKQYNNITQKNIAMPTNELLEESTYYFDSLIAAFSPIVEGPQKDEFKKIFGGKVENIFPDKKTVNLFWEIYMLRNRIVHFTEPRYDKVDEQCIRFMEFSSKARIINIDDDFNIHMNSTLIDINKSEKIRDVIAEAIKKEENPFDIMFPNKSAKGYGKKNPFIYYIANDIFFDYIDSTIGLINKIHMMFRSINTIFLEEFLKDIENRNEIINSNTRIIIGNSEIEYSISDVFYEDDKEE